MIEATAVERAWARLLRAAPAERERIGAIQRSLATSHLALRDAALDPDAHDLCVLIDRRLPELIERELDSLPPDDRGRRERVASLVDLVEHFARHCGAKRDGRSDESDYEAEVLRRRFEERLAPAPAEPSISAGDRELGGFGERALALPDGNKASESIARRAYWRARSMVSSSAPVERSSSTAWARSSSLDPVAADRRAPEVAVGLAAAGVGEDHRQGHLAVAKIVADALAHGLGVGRIIDRVVGQLEGDAEVAAVGFEREFGLLAGSPRRSARPGRRRRTRPRSWPR